MRSMRHLRKSFTPSVIVTPEAGLFTVVIPYANSRTALSETCDDDSAHLITHVHTTAADVHEAMCTELIHHALNQKGLSPNEHLVDAAYVSAGLLQRSRAHHGIDLIGPARKNMQWQSNVS